MGGGVIISTLSSLANSRIPGGSVYIIRNTPNTATAARKRSRLAEEAVLCRVLLRDDAGMTGDFDGI